MVSLSLAFAVPRVSFANTELLTVDRAFVHMDYLEYNLPNHLHQDS